MTPGSDIYLVPSAKSRDVDQFVAARRHAGDLVRVVRGHRMRTSSGAYSEISAAFQLPLRFRPNAASLRAHLSELVALGGEQPQDVVITQIDQLLVSESDEVRREIIEALWGGISHWGTADSANAHKNSTRGRRSALYLTGATDAALVVRDWTDAGARPKTLASLPSNEFDTAASPHDERERDDVRLGFNTMSTLAGFVELAGARWRSNPETAQMVHLSDVGPPGAHEIDVGIWIPSLADGGLPGEWVQAHVLTSATDLDPSRRFDVSRTLNLNVPMSKVERLERVSAIFDSLILPALSLCESIKDMQPGGRGRPVIEASRVAESAAELLLAR